MEVDALKIYIDRLAGGKKQELPREVDSAILELDDDQLRFPGSVSISGKAYIAGDELIVHFDLRAAPEAPCSVCMEWAKWDLLREGIYITKPLEKVKGAVLDITELLREEILVNIPYVVECGGACPKRRELGKLIKEEKEEGESYQPFADL